MDVCIVMQMIDSGKSQRQIADKFHTSLSTCRAFVKANLGSEYDRKMVVNGKLRKKRAQAAFNKLGVFYSMRD